MKKINLVLFGFVVLLSSCGKDEKIISYVKSDNYLEIVDNSDLKFSNTNSFELENLQKIIEAGDNINRAYILLSENDSAINVISNMKLDHRIFGYKNPDTNSERLILFSVFTNEVENNSCNCKYGSYYDSGSLEGISINFKGFEKDFIKAVITDRENKNHNIYFEKKWIDFY